ncbi:hypothetical protein TYRP_014692 [Tyrophagus putrescentiae]|nr:hypothetical protein TYRP_014692 [Tyrophagus putrescentiae]
MKQGYLQAAIFIPLIMLINFKNIIADENEDGRKALGLVDFIMEKEAFEALLTSIHVETPVILLMNDTLSLQKSINVGAVRHFFDYFGTSAILLLFGVRLRSPAFKRKLPMN